MKHKIAVITSALIMALIMPAVHLSLPLPQVLLTATRQQCQENQFLYTTVCP